MRSGLLPGLLAVLVLSGCFGWEYQEVFVTAWSETEQSRRGVQDSLRPPPFGTGHQLREADERLAAAEVRLLAVVPPEVWQVSHTTLVLAMRALDDAIADAFDCRRGQAQACVEAEAGLTLALRRMQDAAKASPQVLV